MPPSRGTGVSCLIFFIPLSWTVLCVIITYIVTEICPGTQTANTPEGLSSENNKASSSLESAEDTADFKLKSSHPETSSSQILPFKEKESASSVSNGKHFFYSIWLRSYFVKGRKSKGETRDHQKQFHCCNLHPPNKITSTALSIQIRFGYRTAQSSTNVLYDLYPHCAFPSQKDINVFIFFPWTRALRYDHLHSKFFRQSEGTQSSKLLNSWQETDQWPEIR